MKDDFEKMDSSGLCEYVGSWDFQIDIDLTKMCEILSSSKVGDG